ncbi:MAG: preprotein translocase subunit SecG [Pseudomonadota bacterium]
MENVILIVHLLLALALIAVVLLQRSEGGGLGIGGGGGAMSGRAAATPLGKVTWGLAIAFIATSMTLTIFAAANSENASVVDRLQDVPRAPASAPATGDVPSAEDLLPPSLGGGSNAPLVPQAAE